MRINVIGSSGSGKTTLGKRLSNELGIPFIEMDSLFWKPNWEPTGDEEFMEKVEKALAVKSWVLDGSYTRTIPIKWKDIDLVIFMDTPFIRTIFQVIKRAVSRIIKDEVLWENSGNKESWKSLFSRDSIVLWAISQHKKNKVRFLSYINDQQFSHINFVKVSSPREADELVARLVKERAVLNI